MSPVPVRTYRKHAHIAREDRYGQFRWCEAWAWENGALMTKSQCRREAKRDGVRAVFQETPND